MFLSVKSFIMVFQEVEYYCVNTQMAVTIMVTAKLSVINYSNSISGPFSLTVLYNKKCDQYR